MEIGRRLQIVVPGEPIVNSFSGVLGPAFMHFHSVERDDTSLDVLGSSVE